MARARQNIVDKTVCICNLFMLSVWVDDSDIEITSTRTERFHSESSFGSNSVSLGVQTFVYTHAQYQSAR